MDCPVSKSKRSKYKVKSRYKRMLKRCGKRAAECEDANSDGFKYLMRIMEVINTVKDDDYEMGVLAENVFNEIKGKEVFYAKSQLTSKLLEDLLPYSTDQQCLEFIEPFIENLRPIFTDRLASHILEKILTESFRRYTKPKCESTDEEQSIAYYDTVIKISGFALNNLDNFIWDSSCNHVIRTILNVLSGHSVKRNISDSEPKSIPPTNQFQSTVIKFADAVMNFPQFFDLCYETLTSGLLQTLLLATQGLSNVCEPLIKKIIQLHKSESPDFKDPCNEPLLRLLEVIMEVASEKQMKKIHKRYFRSDLKGLSVSKTGNFAVQKLIRHCKSKEDFETILEELTQSGEEILEARNTGVLLELAQGCLRFKTKQGEFVKMMLRILKCEKTKNEDSDITPLTCCMLTSDKYDPEAMKMNLHGTLIVQAMLNFGKPIKIINSLLNMESNNLLSVISDPRGCHIVDAFIQSSTVGEKSRDRLFKKLLGFYTQLATSKHGSRSLDAIWGGITLKNRIQLMEELMKNESELNGNQFGKLFAKKTYLYHFRRNREEWIKRDKTIETAKSCFSDIIPSKKPKLGE